MSNEEPYQDFLHKEKRTELASDRVRERQRDGAKENDYQLGEAKVGVSKLSRMRQADAEERSTNT